MKIAIGADHRGTHAAQQIERALAELGHEVTVFGDADATTCDYPEPAYDVAFAVAEGRAEFGVLVCGTGIGVSIAANKVTGVRAALVRDELGAQLARSHNDANVLCMAADMLSGRNAERLVGTFLATPFEGGRHARRVGKIAAIERGENPAAVVTDHDHEACERKERGEAGGAIPEATPAATAEPSA